MWMFECCEMWNYRNLNSEASLKELTWLTILAFTWQQCSYMSGLECWCITSIFYFPWYYSVHETLRLLVCDATCTDLTEEPAASDCLQLFWVWIQQASAKSRLSFRNIPVFWDTTSCQIVNSYRLYDLSAFICMEIEEDLTVHQHRCENLKVSTLCTRAFWCIIQGIHKRMVRLQKLTKKLFLNLHGHNVHRQQRQLSKFLMCYQQFAFRPYCGAAGPVFKMASQQEKAFCVLRFEVSRSVITVPRSTHQKRTAGSAYETRRVAAADGVRFARIRWEINFLLTFETAPFTCKRTVYILYNIKLYKNVRHNHLVLQFIFYCAPHGHTISIYIIVKTQKIGCVYFVYWMYIMNSHPVR